jgi:DNA-binding response OmpR family regulator
MEQLTATAEAEYTVTLDDDVIVHRIVERSIGIRSLPFHSAEDLAKAVDTLNPVAAFIDINLGEGISGLELIPKLREKWPFCPLIIITADPSESAVSEALACGADDFVTKPIRAKELLARLQARLVDQAQKEAKQSLHVGNLTFDNAHRLLVGPHGHRYLSTTEANLLMCLLQAKGTIVLRETLKLRCWGPLKVSDGALDRKIFEVRRALKEIGGSPTIRTAYGVGFGIEVQETS